MPEWLSYSLSDFMMFSKGSYVRLFELHNRAVWPAQIAVLGAAVAILILALRGGSGPGRLISAIVAGFWLTCAWSFHLERYASIHLAAPIFAGFFAAQALLLVWIGIIRGRVVIAKRPVSANVLGWFVFIVAFAVYPLLAPLAGRPWLQAEVVGLAPDPTAAAAFALVLLAARPRPWALLVVPIAWSIVSAATLWSLGAREQALVLPVIAMLTLSACTWQRRAREEDPGR